MLALPFKRLRRGKFKAWPDGLIVKSTQQLVDLYNQGFAGCGQEEDVDEALDATLEFQTFADAAASGDMMESGKGKLVLPFLAALEHNPQMWPGPAQRTGSCVSRGTVNAAIISIYCEVAYGRPDEHTGLIEGPPPDVPHPDQQQFSHEIIYGARGHRGQGSSCSRLAMYVSEEGGLLPRGEHDVPGYGKFDCSKYSDKTAANFGPMTPKPLLDYARKHSYVRTVTRVRNIEEARDALANGYGLNCCSGLGFNGPRNEDGVTDRSGSWSHAMAWAGCDDRPWAHEKYGGPLFLIFNSWAVYNRGPRQVHGTQYVIPHGTFWVRARDAQRILDAGGSFAFSSVNGFPPKRLPDWGLKGLI